MMWWRILSLVNTRERWFLTHWMPFVCHTTMQQCFNSIYHQNFTTNKESRKTFLNFMHGGRAGGRRRLENTVALFGKKQNWITWLSWKLIPQIVTRAQVPFSVRELHFLPLSQAQWHRRLGRRYPSTSKCFYRSQISDRLVTSPDAPPQSYRRLKGAKATNLSPRISR